MQDQPDEIMRQIHSIRMEVELQKKELYRLIDEAKSIDDLKPILRRILASQKGF